jgi:hypothetical protein
MRVRREFSLAATSEIFVAEKKSSWTGLEISQFDFKFSFNP